MGLSRSVGAFGSKYFPEPVKSALRPHVNANTERTAKILDFVTKTDTVLDVGCVKHDLTELQIEPEKGAEFLFTEIASKTPDTVGIDIVEGGVETLQESGYDARVADAQDFDLGQRFNTIVGGEIIEHLENPGDFLQCCKDHLNPGGQIIITTPNPRRLQMLSWFLTGRDEPGNPEHTMWFDWFVMNELTSRMGLKIEDWTYYGPGWAPVSLLLYKLGVAKDLSAGGYIFRLVPE